MKRILTILTAALFLAACSGNKDLPSPTPSPPSERTASPKPSPSPVAAEEIKAETIENLEGMAVNPLTGLYIDEATAKRRPFAVVINNVKTAWPQSGVSQADMYYEVLAEADITRVIALFQDFSSAKIGSIRSARDYFVDFALDHDAIFVHHGGSDAAYRFLINNKIDSINGMKLDGGTTMSNTFFRDPARYSVPKMREHSSYTNAEKLLSRREAYGYRENKADGYSGLFDFFDLPTLAGKDPAVKITVNYARTNVARFEYDAKTKLYKRFQYELPHMDAENDTQLAVTNILVQTVKMNVIPKDPEGRRAVALVSSGTGYLFTNGTVCNVTWKKDGHFSPTEWYGENGEKLKLNKGKTWVCVISNEPVIE